MIALGNAANLFHAGDHGSTFGGNPVTTAAGLAAISIIEKEKLMEKAVMHHEILLTEIALIPGVKEVRGAGLLIGIELDKNNASVIAQSMMDAGVLVNAANPATIRIAPALTVSPAQIKKFITVLRKVLSDDK
jgi:acetylornithine aminotransferase